MDDTKKLLIVRVPAGDLPALEAMRDYIQASLQLGVVAVQEDTTLELTLPTAKAGGFSVQRPLPPT